MGFLNPINHNSAAARYKEPDVAQGNEIGLSAPIGKVPSGMKDAVERLGEMPSSIGARDYIQAAHDAGAAEMGQWVSKQYIRMKEREIRAKTGMYKQAAEFGMSVMSAAEQAGLVDVQFAKASLKHGITRGGQQAEVSGMMAATQRYETLARNASRVR